MVRMGWYLLSHANAIACTAVPWAFRGMGPALQGHCWCKQEAAAKGRGQLYYTLVPRNTNMPSGSSLNPWHLHGLWW